MNDMTFAQRMAAGKAKKAALKDAPRHDLAAQIETLGPDSLLSDRDRAKAAKTAKTTARKASNTARKAEADAEVAKIKAERKTVKAKGEPKTMIVKAMKIAKAKGKKALPPKPIFAAKTASAKHIKGVDAPAPKVVKRVVVVKAKPAPVPEVQDAAALPGGPLLMERSYKRAFTGMGATMRGKVLQITVTFKPEQFDVLKERADLYQCSLAEAVRKCVMAGPLPSSD